MTTPIRKAINVLDFGARGDGVTDDRAAIQRAFNAATAIAASALSSRYSRKPTVYIPAGVYAIGSGFDPINVKGFTIEGEGSTNSILHYTGAADVPILDFGLFNAAPTILYTDESATARINGLRIQNANLATPGTRYGQGVRMNSGGSVHFTDIAVMGFKYGLNSPYGADFNRYNNCLVEYCDVGLYQGPGGQQLLADGFVSFRCTEGVVLDKVNHALFNQAAIIDSRDAAIVIEAFPTGTRQLTSHASGGASLQNKIVFANPWFESNAESGQQGAVNDIYVTTHYVEFRTPGVADAYRDIVISDPIVFAGRTTAKTTTSFARNATTPGCQRFLVERPVFHGTMTRWFTDQHPSWRLVEPRTTNGFTAPAFSNLAGNDIGRIVLEFDTISTLAALPVASAPYRGQIMTVTAAGVDDRTYVCKLLTGGTFAWVDIG